MPVKRGRLPLTALRSFEAAGRLMSFGRAAEELFVSQAAISRQIRDLEVSLGRPLFRRLHRRVELTEAGRHLLDQLTKSFDDIDRRLSQVIDDKAQGILKVSVEPAFAGALLVPRLDRFRKSNPEIDVVVDSDSRLTEFRGDEVQLAIRHGSVVRSWPRTEARHLLDVFLTPVLTPALLASGATLSAPDDLRNHTLLHEADRNGWALWFQAAGFPDFGVQRGPIYPDASLVMQAARLGHGVALGDRTMERDELSTGILVKPFELEVAFGAYWLVAPDFHQLNSKAKAFADWAVTEFACQAAEQ